ncbi:hypothetical protein DVV91_07565 [Clostridium botulinum]|uniref:hypothetical protein n=1 Tax=Clostridium botulinum TaxID=1491 RepID=UPI0007738530|nr:hypothetical protein [Clostridium botulinum]MBN1035386.1 hypothetical protein [Clostridium botulinum]MBN1074202.1 hypothetical protein [Clostridium botulinum]NFE96640.1 hypothetical protein [Clostridium botulinum]NFL40057.1 hypothetical protein [Clostridium botulinum]NFL67128.1 hypothetical protein [Clostridium botulinum]
MLHIKGIIQYKQYVLNGANEIEKTSTQSAISVEEINKQTMEISNKIAHINKLTDESQEFTEEVNYLVKQFKIWRNKKCLGNILMHFFKIINYNIFL